MSFGAVDDPPIYDVVSRDAIAAAHYARPMPEHCDSAQQIVCVGFPVKGMEVRIVREGVVVLASAQPEGKVALIAGVTPGLTKRIQAGKLVGAVAKVVGGSGGGKADIAEAGGKDPAQIDAALQATPGIVADLLT